MYTNVRYILYLLILLLGLTAKINFSRILQLFSITFSAYLVLALILHFLVLSWGEQFEWNVRSMPIFKSNNDAFHRSEWGEAYYSPYLFLLIGDWSYDFSDYSFVRFMGFSPEPSILCMILIPLFFISLYFASSINRIYLVCTAIFAVSIILSFSIYCWICIISSFLIFYNFIKLTAWRLFLSFFVLSLFVYCLFSQVALFNVILEQKTNEFLFYTEALDIFNRIKTLSLFGIDTSHYANESIRSYGVFSVYEKYGLLGFTLWFFTTLLFLYYSFKLSKYTQYKYLSCLLVAIFLYSFKSPHLINFYYIIFLIQSIYYINDQRNNFFVLDNNIKSFIKPLVLQ
jgi:hypothetical protein